MTVPPIPKAPDYLERHYQAHQKLDDRELLTIEDHAAIFHFYSEAADKEQLPAQRHLYEKYRDHHAKRYHEKLARQLAHDRKHRCGCRRKPKD